MLVGQHIHILIVLNQSLGLPAEIILKGFVRRVMRGNFQLIGNGRKFFGKIFGIVDGFQLIVKTPNHGAGTEDFPHFFNLTGFQHLFDDFMKFFNA